MTLASEFFVSTCFHQVIGLQAAGVGWIARATVPALVERQEPRRLALQLGAETHLDIVHRHVRDAAPRLEQQFLRVARGLVLDDGVGYRLLGQRVLQLKSQHRQAIDENHQIQLVAGIVAVAHLAGDAENVLVEGFGGDGISRRGQHLVEIGPWLTEP